MLPFYFGIEQHKKNNTEGIESTLQTVYEETNTVN